MVPPEIKLNNEVTRFLNNLNHPLIEEIEQLRKNILAANPKLTENIKWNAPNFCFEGNDSITMRIHPPTQIQLIFHRGAKTQEQPASRLVDDDSGLLTWKTNDRAVATFKNMPDIIAKNAELNSIINKWLAATTITA